MKNKVATHILGKPLLDVLKNCLTTSTCGRTGITRLLLAGLLCVVSLVASPHDAKAQGVFGYFTDNLVYMPQLTGEARITPIVMRVTQGSESVFTKNDPQNPTKALSLTSDLGFNEETPIFLDAMFQAGLGRFSFRFFFEQRNFTGRRYLLGDGAHRVARFEYSGIRLGVGADVIKRPALKAGIAVDYDLYNPIFTNAIPFNGGTLWARRLVGDPACTLGAYVSYTAPVNYAGLAPTFDASYNKSVMGSEVTDYRIAGGIELPTTILGTLALKTGYRRTNVQYSDKQYYDGSNNSQGTLVDITFGGIFAEIAYYY